MHRRSFLKNIGVLGGLSLSLETISAAEYGNENGPRRRTCGYNPLYRVQDVREVLCGGA